jgi:kynureninase
MPQTRADLAALDAADPLARHRDAFDLPDGVIYLDGNSLGAMPKAAATRLARVLGEEWRTGLIRSWRGPAGWMALPGKVGDAIAGLIGAVAGEVMVADSTSVNLFKLLAAALKMNPGRTTIVTETDNFPTDIYIAEGLTRWLGPAARLKVVPRQGLIEAIDGNTAVLTLTHVDYRTAEIHDMAALTRAAQAKGALVLWDLAHSAGAVPVDLNGAGADLAVGCGYKFLNGGPGAPAYLFVAKRHQDRFIQPLSGWLGHDAPFAFETSYRPAAGIARALCGTPPVLSLAALDEGVQTLLAAGMPALRTKSTALTARFIELVEQECAGHELALASPREPERRGSQVSFRHAQAETVMAALIARGVIGDFRSPDILRFGFAPLYVRFVDLWDAVAVLKDILLAAVRPAQPRRAARL